MQNILLKADLTKKNKLEYRLRNAILKVRLTILAMLIVFPGPRQKMSVSLRSTMYTNLPGDHLDHSKFQSTHGMLFYKFEYLLLRLEIRDFLKI